MKGRSVRGSFTWVSFVVLVMAGCASSASAPALRAAERDDRAALGQTIAAAERAGTLSNRDAATLARVVAARELRTASGDAAVARVHEAAACARELDDALAARMRTHDAAGARAALARVEGGALAADDGRPFANDGEVHWRAFGVRALTRPADDEARRRALVDPDPLVRREAARAAREAARTAGSEAAVLGALAALAEPARVDPEPIVRTEAVRAITALPATPKGEVAGALRDLWTFGDDGLREDIAVAWARSPVWEAGGREALRVLVASEHGAGAIEGAAAVLRRRDADDEMVEASVGQLARAIASGPRTARLQALAEAPLDRGNVLALVQKAASDDDLEVRVAALSRLLGAHVPQVPQVPQVAHGDDAALAALEALAQPGSAVAGRARFALAIARDRRVQAWIEEDLGSVWSEERLAAAAALAAMGVPARGAPLLADAEPGVRVRAACTILLGVRFVR